MMSPNSPKEEKIKMKYRKTPGVVKLSAETRSPPLTFSQTFDGEISPIKGVLEREEGQL